MAAPWSFLKSGSFLKKKPGCDPRPFAAIEPAEPLCLLGDLHGCSALLARFLDLRRKRFPDHRLVVLGDMIDRGPDSAGTLARLHIEAGAICLMGNHEAMLLAALEDPAANAMTWLRHGGLETLNSFGLQAAVQSDAALRQLADALRARIGAELESWLRALPLWWQSGNLVAAHAGLDPQQPVAAQSAQSLLWGHPAFLHQARRDGIHVAHGHFIRPRPGREAGRIALDSGACVTGKLSFALVDPRLPEPERVTIAQIG